MKIHVHAAGESDVGIPDYNETIEIEWPNMDGDDEERERVRVVFRDAFGELTGDGCEVTFDDECYACRMKDGHKPGCWESPEFAEEQRQSQEVTE